MKERFNNKKKEEEFILAENWIELKFAESAYMGTKEKKARSEKKHYTHTVKEFLKLVSE